ncbi:hypothetical protein GIY09_04000 [Aerococcaceae bacterium WS4759]|uniref:GAP family protein n=1 Tax=Fundicoccus ignavus TaxID=2664442 RepID=A0A6I2GNE9_9LACT|nr:GAP family protein [Fundicoccus ignavus]MRI85035.1 hypothetical protein [Fundicoccus ignavus]
MISLLMTTVSLGLVDSLNPFGVSMQFVLQGLVKKKWHIWFYIVATGVGNMIGGVLAYFGLFNVVFEGFNYLLVNYQPIVVTLELVLAFGLGAFVVYQMIQPKQTDTSAALVKVRSVSPTALVMIGGGAAISELVTTLPYFAFLAVLFSQNLSPLVVMMILVIYNVLYTAPLIALFMVYHFANQQFDRLYAYIQQLIGRFSDILTPLVIALIAIFLVYHSVSQLIA